MRLRHLALAAGLTLATATSSAHAQKKPKRPKKPPKTEQPKPPPEIAPDHPPPPIDTELKETEPAPAPKARDSERKSSTWTSHPLLVGATVGYASQNLRIGLGLRAGYSFLDTYYVGLAFTYQLGVDIGDSTFSGFYPGLEFGYDYHVEGITIRPYAGVGMFFARASIAGESVTGDGLLSIYPGVTVDYQIANTPGFIGVDLRLLLIFGAEPSADPSFGAFAFGGVRF